MRRTSIIVFAALLLAVAAATPLAAPLALIAIGLIALAPPARASGDYGALTAAAPSSPQSDIVALILFRGPPAHGFSMHTKKENLNPEVSKWARGVGFEPSPCT